MTWQTYKKKPNQGMALISVLAITTVSLIVISAAIVVSIVDSKITLTQLRSQRAYQAAEALSEEAVLRFVRFRDCLASYSEWTQPCLQIQDAQCKIDCSLTESGGTIDVWGKNNNNIRHLQIELTVTEDESVSVSARREIY